MLNLDCLILSCIDTKINRVLGENIPFRVVNTFAASITIDLARKRFRELQDPSNFQSSW